MAFKCTIGTDAQQHIGIRSKQIQFAQISYIAKF